MFKFKNNSCSGEMLKVSFMESCYLNVVRSNTYVSGEEIKLNGLEWEILKSLQRVLNFTYELYELPTWHYGILLKNNTWTGAVGQLASNSVDFTLSGLTHTYVRAKVIDFTVPYVIDTYSFYVGVEEVVRTWILFMVPFERYVWLAFFLTIAVVSVLLYVFSTNKSKSFSSLTASVLRIAIKQGFDVPKMGFKSSCVFASWLLTYLLLSIAYSDTLTASTGVFIRKHVDTLEELANILRLGHMKFLLPEQHSIVNIVEGMAPLPYGNLFRQTRLIREMVHSDYKLISERQLTFVMSRIRGELILFKKGYPESKIKVVNEPFAIMNTAVAMRKNFKCKNEFNWVILKLRESGCLPKWFDELRFPITLQNMKDLNTGTAFLIGPHDLKSTFNALFLGWIASLFIATIARLRILIMNRMARRVEAVTS